jgi:hypothetical protein
MRRLRAADLVGLQWGEQRAVVLASRPLAADSRIQWWSAFIEDLRDELNATVTQTADHTHIGELSSRLIDLALEVRDITATDAAVMTVSTARIGWESGSVPSQKLLQFQPEQVAGRCISAINIDISRAQQLIRQERTFLLTDERAWADQGRPEPERDTSAFDEFQPLDDLRRILGALKYVEPEVHDAALSVEIRRWLELERLLQHDEQVARKGIDLLAARSGTDYPAD